MTDINAELERLGMRAEMWPVDKLLEISKGTKNPKKHFNDDIAALTAAIKDVGFKGFAYINKDGTQIPAGNGRILAASRAGLKEIPVIRILDLDKARLKKFSLGDNKLRSEKYDENILLEILGEIKASGELFDYLGYDKYNKMLEPDMAAAAEAAANFEIPVGDIASSELYRAPGGPVGSVAQDWGGDRPGTGGDDALQEPPADPERPEFTEEEIKKIKNSDSQQGDIVFPSEPEYGIPILSMKYQATEVVKPVVKWGEISRKAKMQGIWHFYVEDHKFETLYYNDPNAPLLSGAVACVEPNFSIRSQTPKAWALGQTFKKRWLARYWQSKGMRIFVDLNMGLDWAEVNMLGVPRGWTAYATRGYNEVVEHMVESYKFAQDWAETDDIIFLVIGGGKEVQKTAADYQWFWIPERMQVVSNPKFAGMDGLPPKVAPEEYADLK